MFIRLACILCMYLLTACASRQESINADVLPKLQEELQRQLASLEDVATAPHAPIGDYGKPRNVERTLGGHGDDPAYIISWDYFNYGDYDMNGLVNTADLAPIAKYYGSTPADASWPEAEWVDGDGNGEIGLSDIGPIAANYQGSVAVYVFEYSFDGTTFTPYVYSIQPGPRGRNGRVAPPRHSMWIGDEFDGSQVRIVAGSAGGGGLAAPSESFTMDFDGGFVIYPEESFLTGRNEYHNDPDNNPVMYSISQTLNSEPLLPGSDHFLAHLKLDPAIMQEPDLAARDCGIPGAVFGPAGLEWLQPLKVWVTYWSDDLKPGIDPLSLRLYYHDGTEWVEAAEPQLVGDVANNTASIGGIVLRPDKLAVLAP